MNETQKLEKIIWLRDDVKPIGEGYDDIRQLQTTEFQLLPSKQKFLVEILIAPFAFDRRLNVLGVVEKSEVTSI